MIAIIAAMNEEVEAIVELMDESIHKSISRIDFYEGSINKQKIIVSKSGVGKGAASMATTILLEHYDVDFVINIGTAGGLKPQEKVLDAIVSSKVVQHDFDTSFIDGESGKGLYFEASQPLVDFILKVLSNLDINYHVGLVASGDLFIAGDKLTNALTSNYPDAMCCEMEAGAIAQVCSHYEKPFVILRSLSDVACNSDSHLDFMAYKVHASKRSALITKKVCEMMVDYVS